MDKNQIGMSRRMNGNSFNKTMDQSYKSLLLKTCVYTE